MTLDDKLTISGIVSYYKTQIENNINRSTILNKLKDDLKEIVNSRHTTKQAKNIAQSLINDKWDKITSKTKDIRKETTSNQVTAPPQTGSLTINGSVEQAIQNNNPTFVENSKETPQLSPTAAENERGRESSPSSFCSDTYHPNRQYKHTYENVIPWDDTDEKWDIDHLDILLFLKEFRSSSTRLTKLQGNINDIRILSLHSVFPFMLERNKSITRYMDPIFHNIIKKEFSAIYGETPLPNTDLVIWCMSLSIFDGEWSEVKERCIDILNEARSTGDDVLKLASYVLYDLVPRLVQPEDASEDAEDTFIHKYLNAFLDNIFSTEKLFYQAWANLTLNNSNDSLKPDWTLYIKPWYTRFDLASCEVKPPSKVGRGDITDFVKIGLELQDMLNALLEIGVGVEDAYVFGILVEGAHISIYGMDVKGQAYRMYQIKSLQLITKQSQLPLFPLLFAALVQVKNLALQTARKVDEIQRKKALGKRVERDESEKSSRSSSSTPVLKKYKVV